MWSEEYEFSISPDPQDILFPKNIIRGSEPARSWGPEVIANNQDLRQVLWTLGYDRATGIVSIRNSLGVSLEMFTIEGTAFRFDLTFSADGRPFVAYEKQDGSYIFWYDPLLFEYVITHLGDGNRNPFCSIDYTNVELNQLSDVIVLYEREGQLYYVISNERYTLERQVPDFPELRGRGVVSAGIGTKLRYTIIYR